MKLLALLALLALLLPSVAVATNYPQTAVQPVVIVGTAPAGNYPYIQNTVLPIQVLGGIVVSSNVAFTNVSNTFTSSQTIRDGRAGGLLVAGDSVTASAFFGDGSHLTGITGGGGGTPGGSNYQIQFSSNGTFGGIPLSVVDSTKAFVGLQATPAAPLHVAGILGETVAAPASASASLVQDVGITSPTVYSVSQVNEPNFPAINSTVLTYIEPDNGSMSANQNTGETGYTATGQTITYNVYGYRNGPSGAIINPTPNTFSVTDFINDGTTQFGVDLNGFSTPSSQIDGYLIVKQDDQGYGPYWIAVGNPSLTTYNDTGYTNQDAYAASGYVSGGSSWSLGLAQYIIVPNQGLYLRSAYATNPATDDSSGNYLIVQGVWSAPTNDGYVVTNNAQNTFADIGNAISNYVDYGQSFGGGDLPVFSSYAFPYFNTSLSGDTGTTIQIDYGSGSLFADNSNYFVQVWEYRYNPTNGVRYFIGSPDTTSTVNDDNSGNPMSLSGSFTPGDGDGRVVILWKNGAPVGQQDVGGGSSYSGLDDSQPVQPTTPFIGSYSGITRAYQAYGRVTSPAVKYSSLHNDQSFTDNNPVGGYLISHSYSGLGNATSIKIIDTSFSQHVIPETASPITELAGGHDGDTTVSPQTIGYLANGANLNMDYRIYADRTIGSVGVYSSSAAHVTTTDPNDGLYYTVHVSYAAVPLAQYKAVRSVNGGAAQGFSNGPTSFVDSIQTGWGAVGALTPNYGPIQAAQFERASDGTLASQPPVVTFKNTNGSYTAQRFDWDNAGTNVGHWGINSTADSYIDGFHHALLVGNPATPHTILADGTVGLHTIFNNTANSNNTTWFKGGFFSYDEFIDPSVDTVYFGSNQTHDGGTPNASIAAIGNGGHIALTLSPDPGVSLDSNLMTVKNSGSQVQFAISNGGHVAAGYNSVGPASLTVGPSDSSHTQIVLENSSSLPSSPIPGGIERYDNQSALYWTDKNGNRVPFVFGLGAGTATQFWYSDASGNPITSNNWRNTGTLLIAGLQIEAKAGLSLDSGQNLTLAGTGTLGWANVTIGAPAGTMIEVSKNLIVDTTATVKGNAFSVGGSSFTVSAGSATVAYNLNIGSLTNNGQSVIAGTETVKGNSFSVGGSTLSVAFGTTTLGGLLQGTTGYFKNQVTASTFSGSGYSLQNFIILGSSEPSNNPSIASASYIGIATMTVTLRGGRQAMVSWHFNSNNSSGGSRDYTSQVTMNGANVADNPTITNAQSGYALSFSRFRIASTTAGANTFVLNVKSSNATGTQTAVSPEIDIEEY